MLKNLKYIGIGTLALAFVSLTSCSDDFLTEKMDTAYMTDYFDTPEGLESLTTSLYGHIRWHFAYGWSFSITSYGVDEFTNGNDLTSEPWNTYDARLSPIKYDKSTGASNDNCASPADLWDQMYYGIASANIIIAKADQVFTNQEQHDRCLAHAYFLRGYNYYRLAAQYGGVVLQTTPVDGVVRSFTRATDEQTWEQAISDLRKAYELFSGEVFTYGKGVTWTKATAAHFLAKALLFRASERNNSWNGQYIESDLKEAIAACDYAIKSRTLADNYSNLYMKFDKPNCSYEELDEILMSCPANGTAGTDGRFGQQVYPLFTCQFSNFSVWVKRGAWVGLDYQRCRPTEYTYAVFDHVNDARMWKTFKTVYGINVIGNEEKATAEGLSIGDPAIVMILNTKDDHTYDKYIFGNAKAGIQPTWKDENNRLPEGKNGKWAPNSLVLYQNGQYVGNTFGNGTPTSRSNFYCGIGKFEDGSRSGEKGNSNRDVIMARLGETYLLRAECYARQGEYTKAMEDINALRKRAAWKSGEDRSHYEDGTQAFTNNSLYDANKNMYSAYAEYGTYYLSNPGIPMGTTTSTENEMILKSFPDNLPVEDEVIMSKLNITSAKERAINFILNERTRELLGEWQRWDDLSRTGMLIKRAKAFNSEAAANIKEGKHELRPIPQSFIDGLLNEDGSNLSDEQKKAWQNPGY